MGYIVVLALVSGMFQGASALANWSALERLALALDVASFALFLAAVSLTAGWWVDRPGRWVLVLLLGLLAGAWLSDTAERASERLPALPE